MTPLLQIASECLAVVYARRLVLALLPMVAVYLAVATGVMCLEAYRDGSGTGLLLRAIASLAGLVLLHGCFWIAVLLLLTRTHAVLAVALLRISMIWLVVCLLIPRRRGPISQSLIPHALAPEYVKSDSRGEQCAYA